MANQCQIVVLWWSGEANHRRFPSDTYFAVIGSGTAQAVRYFFAFAVIEVADHVAIVAQCPCQSRFAEPARALQRRGDDHRLDVVLQDLVA